jgi:hypothetical protein
LLGFGLLYIVIGGRNYVHYYTILATPLSVLALIPLKKAQEFKSASLVVATIVLLVLPNSEWPVAVGTRYLSGTTAVYQDPLEEVGDFIQQNTSAMDTIFVWGYAPSIYLYSNRSPSFHDVGNLALAGGNFASPKQEDQGIVTAEVDAFKHHFRTAPPALFIYYHDNRENNSDVPLNMDIFTLPQFEYLRQELAQHYALMRSFQYDGITVSVFKRKEQ